MRIPNLPGAKHTIIARDVIPRKRKGCLLKSEEIIGFLARLGEVYLAGWIDEVLRSLRRSWFYWLNSLRRQSKGR